MSSFLDESDAFELAVGLDAAPADALEVDEPYALLNDISVVEPFIELLEELLDDELLLEDVEVDEPPPPELLDLYSTANSEQ